jgi:hypothetical protein
MKHLVFIFYFFKFHFTKKHNIWLKHEEVSIVMAEGGIIIILKKKMEG